MKIRSEFIERAIRSVFLCLKLELSNAAERYRVWQEK